MLQVQPSVASEYETLDEPALVERLAAFDDGAWQVIFQRHHATIVRIAYARTFDRNAAEDIAAEVFAEAVKGIRRYSYRGVPFRAWLFRLARNITSDYIKAKLRTRQMPLDEMAGLLETVPDDLDLRTDFVQALTKLTDDQRTVVVLRLVAECSLAETAVVLGKSEGAIKQLQHRAMAVLRAEMSASQQVGS